MLYTPKVEDDLEMIVKTLFQRIYCVDWHTKIAPLYDVEELYQTWEYYLSPKIWADMVELARDRKYGELKRYIQALLPGEHAIEQDMEQLERSLPPIEGEGTYMPEVD